MRSFLTCTLAILAVALWSGAAAGQPPGAAAGQSGGTTSAIARLSHDVCFQAYGPGTQSTIGGKTVYDRAASLYQACEGFGLDSSGFHLTPAMQCAIIAAAATYGGPVASAGVATGCSAGHVYDAYKSHNWLGLAKTAACGYFGDIFAGAVGIFVAGATSAAPPAAAALGVATYHALAASLTLVCGGVLNLGTQLGKKLESKHETAVNVDIERHGKCLSHSTSFLGSSWAAITCPAAQVPPAPVITGVSGNSGVAGGGSFPVTITFKAPACDILGGTWTDYSGIAHDFAWGGPDSHCAAGVGSTVPGYSSCTSPTGQPSQPGSYEQTIVLRDSYGQQSAPFSFPITCLSH